jgi:hypothetical protein
MNKQQFSKINLSSFAKRKDYSRYGVGTVLAYRNERLSLYMNDPAYDYEQAAIQTDKDVIARFGYPE